ncbi:hypothetical protein [Oleiagrimonas soli]|uniref:Lipoprotein n=1 Tax=Oleiagrimonas soli TaxID=1543381 RepID=A0A099CYN1_9GAMM|nr:hypothetical protein [Oleiagrimonas soli]KGI78859.1 hypothetical protein LF63_0102715 [Oleiagrimonas soli]MBB6184342.1 hypothetical protein [Oleiagrimonas soli]
MKGNIIGAGVALSMLCGCVSMPTFQSAKPMGSAHAYRVHAADPKPIENTLYQFVDMDDTVLYHQEAGGGGVALGVLLGPLGAAANAAAIKSRTGKEALSLRGAFTPHVMQDFSATLLYQPELQPARAADASAVTFSPMLELTRMGEDQVRIGARLRVAQGTPQQRDYLYVLPDSYSFAAL